MATASNNDIARAIYLASKDKAEHSFNADVVKFFVRKRLMPRSKDILEHLDKIINSEKGIIKAKVLSVQKLSEKTKHDLKHFLTKRYFAKEIILNESLDPKLLGGLRVEVGDEVIDLTLRNRIRKLQEYLIKD